MYQHAAPIRMRSSALFPITHSMLLAGMQNTAFAQIDVTAIRHNLAVVRSLCPNSRVMAMVKANAYGHGLLTISRALSTADGLGVARMQEALQLRDSGITQRILLLATLLDSTDLATCSERDIDVAAHDAASVAAIISQARSTPLRVWLKLDSGMHRVGLAPQAFVEADRILRRQAGVLELTHMTHFSNAGDDDARTRQIACFSSCHETNKNAPISIANSAALMAGVATAGDWVRPGIMLYGVNPLGGHESVDLRPSMTLSSYVIAVRHVPIGHSVGYDSHWTSERPSRVGTIGIGYGDGYPRHAKNGTPVWIRGRSVPLIGRVSMDSLTVDLTDFTDVCVGDRAILWGTELPAAKVARHADTISYELFTSIQHRVTREYQVDVT